MSKGSDNQNKRPTRERRNYFRIDDDIYLSYREINSIDLNASKKKVLNGEMPANHLANELSNISKKLHTQLSTLKRKQPEAARSIVLVNEKVDLLIQLVAISNDKNDLHPNNHVNISANGLAFFTSKNISTDTYLELSFKLFPSFKQIYVIGQVVNVNLENEEDKITEYKIAVHFITISDKDQETLQDHTVNMEMNRRRRVST